MILGMITLGFLGSASVDLLLPPATLRSALFVLPMAFLVSL